MGEDPMVVHYFITLKPALAAGCMTRSTFLICSTTWYSFSALLHLIRIDRVPPNNGIMTGTGWLLLLVLSASWPSARASEWESLLTQMWPTYECKGLLVLYWISTWALEGLWISGWVNCSVLCSTFILSISQTFSCQKYWNYTHWTHWSLDTPLDNNFSFWWRWIEFMLNKICSVFLVTPGNPSGIPRGFLIQASKKLLYFMHSMGDSRVWGISYMLYVKLLACQMISVFLIFNFYLFIFCFIISNSVFLSQVSHWCLRTELIQPVFMCKGSLLCAIGVSLL